MRTSRSTQALGLVLLALIVLLTSSSLTTQVVFAGGEHFSFSLLSTCSEEDSAFAIPYDGNWVLTQGLHGQSYGQLALDLAKGAGASQLSPIKGTVTQAGIDVYGNTYIVIENSCYRVLLVHGDYTVGKEAPVEIGTSVGTEGNHGNVYCADGFHPSISLYGPNCGYHLHLNVFDKRVGTNVDPRTLVTQENIPVQSASSGFIPEIVRKVDSAQSAIKLWQEVKEVNWGLVIMVTILLVLAGFLLINGLKLRPTMVVIGLILLAYAWWLPSRITTLPTPVKGITDIVQFFGDVRVDPAGSTGLEYKVSANTEILSITPGKVIETPSALSWWGQDQLWIQVGNGLYIQYLIPNGSLLVNPGETVTAGEPLARSVEATVVRLGISSKHPSLFTALDDRGFGWLDPIEYLGKTIPSASRPEEISTQIIGWILILIALFWPKGKQQISLPYPWDRRTTTIYSLVLVLSAIILVFGFVLNCLLLQYLALCPLAASLLYTYGRYKFRKRLAKGNWHTGWWDMIVPLEVYVWGTWIIAMLISVIANPGLVQANIDFRLNLPQIIIPGVPAPDVPDPEKWELDYSGESALPEFSFQYWNGSTIRFWVPPEVMEAAVTAYEKNGSCDPLGLVSLAWTEGPTYANICNSIGACGITQFMPGTWEYYFPDPNNRPSRLDIEAEMDATCRKWNNQGLNYAPDKATFVDRFAYHPLKESVWNMHEPQASTVWDLWQELKQRNPSR